MTEENENKDQVEKNSLPILASTKAVMKPSANAVIKFSDKAAAFIGEKEYKTYTKLDIGKSPIVFGLKVIFIFFGIFGVWATLAPLNSAAVAPGSVVQDTNKKTIQHLEGGIVSEILVAEGAKVKKDQVLMKLDPTSSESRLDLLVAQYRGSKAAEDRLTSEQNKLPEIKFSDEILKNEKDQSVVDIVKAQEYLFSTRKEAYESQKNVMQKKIDQLKEEIKGLEAQRIAAKGQLSLINEEIGSVQKLIAEGLSNRPRLLALQRTAQQLQGQIGEYISSVAKANQTINETKLQLISMESDKTSKIAEDLEQTRLNLSDLGEKVKAAKDVYKRIDIKAPQDGIVTGLKFHTVGGVVAPGQAIMDLVPINDKLIIEAKVSPTDIDVVHADLKAEIRLTAYRARRVPMIEGRVVNVSADKFTDERTGASYYTARTEVDMDQLRHLEDNVKLYPGMPADVYIVTGERTLLSYLLDPINDGIHKAFREN